MPQTVSAHDTHPLNPRKLRHPFSFAQLQFTANGVRYVHGEANLP
jgi:hypothetical protein